MKFLMTLNMPAASGMPVHQVIVEHECKNVKDFKSLLSNEEFILAKQWYRRKLGFGDVEWEDRGDIIINTFHIGKVQEFIEYENEEDGNEGRRNTRVRKGNTEEQRGPVRGRNNML